MTYAIAHAAAGDAGNRSMCAAGRTTWNDDDYLAVCREFNRLYPPEQQLADAGAIQADAD